MESNNEVDGKSRKEARKLTIGTSTMVDNPIDPVRLADGSQKCHFKNRVCNKYWIQKL